MSTGLPAFASVADALATLTSLGTAAETHGMLVALLSARVKIRESAWVDSLLNEHIEARDTAGQAAYQVLHQLFAVTQTAFQENDFSVTLLLPDDEAPLLDRVEALAEWCQGYLTGLHLLGLAIERNKNETIQAALNDIVEISQANIDAEDEADPHSEEHFMELVEFVKAAVLMVAAELERELPDVNAQAPTH